MGSAIYEPYSSRAVSLNAFRQIAVTNLTQQVMNLIDREHGRGRIRNSRINVPRAFEIEQRGGVVGILEHVGRGLVDRNRAGAGGGVRALARVQAQGFESRRLGCRSAG